MVKSCPLWKKRSVARKSRQLTRLMSHWLVTIELYNSSGIMLRICSKRCSCNRLIRKQTKWVPSLISERDYVNFGLYIFRKVMRRSRQQCLPQSPLIRPSLLMSQCHPVVQKWVLKIGQYPYFISFYPTFSPNSFISCFYSDKKSHPDCQSPSSSSSSDIGSETEETPVRIAVMSDPGRSRLGNKNTSHGSCNWYFILITEYLESVPDVEISYSELGRTLVPAGELLSPGPFPPPMAEMSITNVVAAENSGDEKSTSSPEGNDEEPLNTTANLQLPMKIKSLVWSTQY